MQNNLRELRKDKKLTLQDVAEALQIPKNTYRQYETGERNMKPEIMIKIAEFFDIPIDEIFLHRLPSRYIRVAADEKKIITQYRTLSPEQQRVIRVVTDAFSPSGEIRKQDGGFRMASRTSGTESPETEPFHPADLEDDTDDIPDDF